MADLSRNFFNPWHDNSNDGVKPEHADWNFQHLPHGRCLSPIRQFISTKDFPL
jgi:hypothetical protein